MVVEIELERAAAVMAEEEIWPTVTVQISDGGAAVLCVTAAGGREAGGDGEVAEGVG